MIEPEHSPRSFNGIRSTLPPVTYESAQHHACTIAASSSIIDVSAAQGEKIMRKLHAIALTGCALAMSQQAFAEVGNLTNSAESATRESAVADAKEKLNSACTERGGKPDAKSFEVVFEKKSPNPDVPKPHYVDAKMKCDLP